MQPVGANITNITSLSCSAETVHWVRLCVIMWLLGQNAGLKVWEMGMITTKGNGAETGATSLAVKHTIPNILLVTSSSSQTSSGLLEKRKSSPSWNGVLKAHDYLQQISLHICLEKQCTRTYTSVRFWSLYISRDWNSLSTPMSRIFCCLPNAPSHSFIHTKQRQRLWKIRSHHHLICVLSTATLAMWINS